MNIEVIKSKISKIGVTISLINNEGVIKMDGGLMDELNMVQNEVVLVINEQTGKQQTLFLESFKSNNYYSMVVPNSIAGLGETVTVISRGRVTIDEGFSNPIIINVENLKK